MLKINIWLKSLLLFLVVSILPLLGTNLIWLRSTQSNLRAAAADQQVLLAASASTRVNEYLTDTVNSLIIHSQTASVQKFDLAYAKQELAAYIHQDADIMRIALVGADGQEKVAFDRHGILSQLNNVKSSDAFQVVTFLSGKEYIAPVNYIQDAPYMVVAVPIVTLENSQNISNLSTAEPGLIRGPNDIKGALIVDISLENLWQGVLSSKLGVDGYAYVVDDKGRLIAHPDQSLIKAHADLSQVDEVKDFLTSSGQNSDMPQQTLSEKKVPVLSTYNRIIRTNWAVVAEEPITSIYANANSVSRQALAFFLVAGILAVGLSLLFSRQFTRPIRKLAAGAVKIGEGDLQYRFNLASQDEIGLLSKTFNHMTDNLARLVRGVEAERNKLGLVLNSINEGVVAVDGRGVIVVCNKAAAELVGISNPAGLTGKFMSEAFRWTMDDQLVVIDTTIPNASYNQLKLKGPDARTHYLDLVVARVLDDPTGIAMIVAIHDETRDRELESMKVDFVSMAAHELRTPLTAIGGYLGLISRTAKGKLSTEQKNYLARAESSTNQLSGLINNLLNVARIERGALSVHVEKLDWDGLVEGLVKDQVFAAKQKSIELKYEPAEQAVEVLGDKVALSEVVNNLISNAIHYSPTGAHITTTVKLQDNQVLTQVSDTGVGIPPEAVPHLFQKFFRVNGGLAMGSGGTGLGLYISKSIIELHHGKIWVESKLGVGSIFSFSLPVFDQASYDKVASNSLNTGENRGWITKNIAR